MLKGHGKVLWVGQFVFFVWLIFFSADCSEGGKGVKWLESGTQDKPDRELHIYLIPAWLSPVKIMDAIEAFSRVSINLV